jgi:TRAP-type mannitol/chloroaromatic compound transport system permease large subunit
MTNPEVAIFMLCLFIFLVLLGFPIAFTLIAMGVGFGYYAYYKGGIETFSDVFDNNIFYLLNQNTYSVMENDTLVAVPLFLFMGYVVERAAIVEKLFYSLQMAAANANYEKGFASGVICAGGTLGILIPPSIMLIVYAAIAELSPLRLRQNRARRMCRRRRRSIWICWSPSCR